MPITQAVHAILSQELSPADAIRGLMEREPKAERVG
jgi:glycerol-3-phosphate dehydrogenase